MLLDYMTPEKLVTTTKVQEFQNFLCEEMATERYQVTLNDLELTNDGIAHFRVGQCLHEFPFTPFFLEDVARYVKIPLNFAISIDFDLFNTNFSKLRMTRTCPVVVAVMDGRAVGLSSPVRPARTIDVVQGIQPQLIFQRAVISDRGVEADYLLDQADVLEPQPGDIIREGIRLSNSETGGPALKISRFTHRLVCSNGMQVAERFGLVRWNYDPRMTYETSIARVHAELHKLTQSRQPLDKFYQESLKQQLTEESLVNIWRRAQRAGLGKDAANEALGLNDTDRLAMQAATRQRARDNLPAVLTERTPFELHNLVTEYAHTRPHHFRVRSELERLGGDILTEYLHTMSS